MRVPEETELIIEAKAEIGPLGGELSCTQEYPADEAGQADEEGVGAAAPGG